MDEPLKIILNGEVYWEGNSEEKFLSVLREAETIFGEENIRTMSDEENFLDESRFTFIYLEDLK